MNNNFDDIQKKLDFLEKSINEMIEKSSFSNKLKAGAVGLSSLLYSPQAKNPELHQNDVKISEPAQAEPEPPKFHFPSSSPYAKFEKQNPLNTLSLEQKHFIENSPLEEGEILEDYRDPRHIPVEEKYEEMYNIPHRMITAIRVAGELSNWSDKSAFDTLTPYQFKPSTRNAFLNRDGVDAHADTESAIHATALHLKDNIRRIEVWKKRNDSRIKGIPLDTDTDKWNLAARLYNGSIYAARSGKNKENNDYAHRMEHGLKILQNNPDVFHLDSIIQEKREHDRQQKTKKPKQNFFNATKKSLLKTRGNLIFPNILPKNSRPEQNVKQLFDPKYQKKYFSAKDLESNDGLYLIDHDKSFSFNPEKNEAISAHEGIHQTISNIAKKINNKDVSVYTKLNSLIPINQKDQIRSFLKYADRYEYKTVHQEILPWLHTILHDKESRNDFLNHHYPINDKNKNIGWDKLTSEELNSLDHPNVKNGRTAIQKLGRSWNNIRYFAKKAGINDLKSNYSFDQRTP